MKRLLLFFIILTGFLIPINVKFEYFQPLVGSAMDLLHFPLGAMIAWIFRKSAILAVSVVLLIEVVQHFTGRNLSLLDASLGASGVLAWYYGNKTYLWPVIILPVLVSLSSCYSAYQNGRAMSDAFPVFYHEPNFEPEGFWFYDNQPINKLVLPNESKEGWRALELRLFGQSWSNCTNLEVKAEVASEAQKTTMLVRIDDTDEKSPAYEDRFNLIKVISTGRNTTTIPLKMMENSINLKSISRLIVATKDKHPALKITKVGLDCKEKS